MREGKHYLMVQTECCLTVNTSCPSINRSGLLKSSAMQRH
jgi:hypothetical protein